MQTSRGTLRRVSTLAFVLTAVGLLGGCVNKLKIVDVVPVAVMPDLAVEISSRTDTALTVVVRNDGAESWNILWEECSYVDPGGRAVKLLDWPASFTGLPSPGQAKFCCPHLQQWRA